VTPELVGSTPETLGLAEEIFDGWRRAGVTGAFLACNVRTRDELGFNTSHAMPLASVVKVPIALVACDRIAAGDLSADQPVSVGPPNATPGRNGVSAFRRPTTIALIDLVYLMLSISDNAATDAVLDLIGLDRVRKTLAGWNCGDLSIRHHIRAFYGSEGELAGDVGRLNLDLAVRDGMSDHMTARQHVPGLDVAKTNTGTAAALVHLLERIWLDQISTPRATSEVRRFMSRQIARHRLQSELGVDGLRVSSKTGTLLNLRHEIGVIETKSDDVIAVAALTSSSIPAFDQPEVDYLIGAAARRSVDILRV
jgi:beta-lactamase class A